METTASFMGTKYPVIATLSDEYVLALAGLAPLIIAEAVGFACVIDFADIDDDPDGVPREIMEKAAERYVKHMTSRKIKTVDLVSVSWDDKTVSIDLPKEFIGERFKAGSVMVDFTGVLA